MDFQTFLDEYNRNAKMDENNHKIKIDFKRVKSDLEKLHKEAKHNEVNLKKMIDIIKDIEKQDDNGAKELIQKANEYNVTLDKSDSISLDFSNLAYEMRK